MSIPMTTVEVDQNTAAILQTLKTKAAALGMSLEALLKPLTEELNGTRTEAAPLPYELVADLIGAADSSVADPSPDAQPRHTAFGAALVEKHNKEIQRSAALENVAAQAGATPAEWVRRNFPNGRDNQGRLLSEALDTLILREASKRNGTD